VKQYIQILDSYSLLVHQYPVFVLPFLFQTLFLYSFSSLLLCNLPVWLFFLCFLGFSVQTQINKLLTAVSSNMSVFIHYLEVPLRHRILFFFTIWLICFRANNWRPSNKSIPMTERCLLSIFDNITMVSPMGMRAQKLYGKHKGMRAR